MTTIFDSHQGLWDSLIDVPTVFSDLFDGNHIVPPCPLLGNWFIALRLGALDANQSFFIGSRGIPCFAIISGNDILSQVTLLLGFGVGVCAYAVRDNSISTALGIHDTDTVHIVDVDGVSTEVKDRQRASKILRFKAKNTKA